jgi:hypothetical protein
VDTTTGKRTSLGTTSADAARQIIEAKNNSERQPVLNLQIAKVYPERFAQEALGHNSKAVHRAYAKRALMKIPSLEDYEQRAAAKVQPAT